MKMKTKKFLDNSTSMPHYNRKLQKTCFSTVYDFFLCSKELYMFEVVVES